MRAREVYDGSDGDLTKRYYASLQGKGPLGVVAMNLFRAQKCSARAKIYRGGIRGKGSYRQMAYDKKNWSMQNLCDMLTKHAGDLAIKWGWGYDAKTTGFEWVLYVDLEPHGQASFHCATRDKGPNHPDGWNNHRKSEDVIIDFCDAVFKGQVKFVVPQEEKPRDVEFAQRVCPTGHLPWEELPAMAAEAMPNIREEVPAQTSVSA